MLVGSCPSAKLESVAEARPLGRFEEMLPEVESQLDPWRVTPITNFGWGVFYTQHRSISDLCYSFILIYYFLKFFVLKFQF